jgi:ABC-2 type transport system ATP-binding protein
VPAIEVEHLTKRFGAVLAVDDLSFSVDAGQVVGFLGPNGAGKSTTLRAVLGLAAPTSGRTAVLGVPYRTLREPARRVGAVLDAKPFYPGRTARDHLRVVAAEAGLDPRRVDEVLALVGLTEADHRKAGGFSLGMHQRLALATALLGDPEVLVLDEPANGLDPEGIRWLRELLRYLAVRGCAVLVSSHLLSEVAQTVDRVVIISRGRLVEDAPLAELTERYASTVSVRTPDAGRLAAILRERGATVAEDGDELRVEGLTAAAVGDAALAASAPLHLLAPASSLEDVFLRLTAGAHEGRPSR